MCISTPSLAGIREGIESPRTLHIGGRVCEAGIREGIESSYGVDALRRGQGLALESEKELKVG